MKFSAVVSTRAFINCQSAEAHFILFRRIFEIAVQDSNQPIAIHYIHGHGIESVVADAHQGQGVGMLNLLQLDTPNSVSMDLVVFPFLFFILSD